MALGRLIAAGALLAWAALLSTPHLDALGRMAGPVSLADARTLWTAAVVGARALWRGLAIAVVFAPLGAFAALALPDQPTWARRFGLVFLPAMALGGVLAWLALARRAGSPPGPFELLLPVLGILVGCRAGLAWRRGWRARLFFLPSLLGQSLVLLLLVGGFAVLALDPQPALEAPKPLSSAEKRHLVGLFRGKNPRKVPEGETRTLSLSGGELDRLAAWAAQATGSRVHPSLSLREDGIRAAASLRVPRIGRWLNVEVAARAGIEQGRLTARDAELRVGPFRVPAPLLQLTTPFLVAGLQGDRDLRQLLPAVDRLALSAEDATLTYSRVDMPPGLIARLVWGEEASDATRAAVYEHVDRLLLVLEGAPEGDSRFGLALETAFAAARQQAAISGQPAQENRVAILALGIVLGHPRLARSVGERLDRDRSSTAVNLYAGTTLRGRSDWSRHFTVSAALTILSAADPSDAAGLLKEELDADGGSGFSFGDLLADRSGTTFAVVATRDDESAQRIQERLARGFQVDDFFPPAADLPEGLTDAELQKGYGGVQGARYREQAAELERRLARCAAYRGSAPEAEQRVAR